MPNMAQQNIAKWNELAEIHSCFITSYIFLTHGTISASLLYQMIELQLTYKKQ